MVIGSGPFGFPPAKDPSFVFTQWSTNEITPSIQVVMDQNKTLTANYVCYETEANDSSPTQTGLRLGGSCSVGASETAVFGAIDTPADEDWYCEGLTLPSGRTITVTLTHPVGYDYDLELYGPDATHPAPQQVFLDGKYGTGTSESITYITEASGAFSARVIRLVGSTGGVYQLSYSRTP
jgi:hypothetical protein